MNEIKILTVYFPLLKNVFIYIYMAMKDEFGNKDRLG